MIITFKCSNTPCGKHIGVKPDLVGKLINCPHCKVAQRVPPPTRLENESNPVVTTRREIMLGLMTGAIGGACGEGLVEGVKYVKGLLEDGPRRAERRLIKELVGAEGPIQLFAGSTNQLAIREGKKGLSPNLTATARNVSLFLTHSNTPMEVVQHDDPALALNESANNLLLLGGPVSNSLMSRLGGYTECTDKPPEFDTTGGTYGLRWYFNCGDPKVGWGHHHDFDHKAFRFDRGHDASLQLVERPLYGLYDRLEGQSRVFSKRDGYLAEEALLITRIRNPFNRDNSKNLFVTMVAGAHGYSTLEFSGTIESSIENLMKKMKTLEQFQVMVPAPLKHDKIIGTTAQLQWDCAEVHRLG